MNRKCTLWLRLLAPYFAVGVFWIGFSNAWLAILGYHLQIVLWHRFGRRLRARITENRMVCCTSLLAVLAGPVVYFLLPRIALVDLAQWLEGYGLRRASLLVMIPYFWVVHPILEQLHWQRLRAETVWAHAFFAGYHVLVLYALLPFGWLVVSFLVLLGISLLWHKAGNTAQARWYCRGSHMLADLGIVLAVICLT